MRLVHRDPSSVRSPVPPPVLSPAAAPPAAPPPTGQRRRRVTRGSAGALLAALCLAVLLVPAAGRGAGATGTGTTTVEPSTKHIGLFAPDWKAITRSDADWVAAVANHDILIGTIADYVPRLPALRAANPRATILMYNAGPYLLEASPVYAEVMASHPEYFARDASGRLIHIRSQPQATLMDQGNPGWRAFHAARLANYLQVYDFDGVDLDSMGWGAVRSYTTSKPVNPATGRTYTSKEWLDLSVLTLNAVKAAVGDKLVLFNGLTNGTSYTVTSVLATSNADGGIAEGFLRNPTTAATAFPGVSAWLANVHMLQDMEARGKLFLAWTKLWLPATEAQKQAWNTFALATYLLANGGRSYFNFLGSAGGDRTSIVYPNQQAALGAPLGPYTVAGPVYSRAFEHGVVSVNPSAGTASIDVTG